MLPKALTTSPNLKPPKASILWLALGLTSLLISINTFAKDAQILNYFPNCKANIVDSVTVKRKLKRRDYQKSKDLQLTKAIAELVSRANKRDVEAIIITKSYTSSVKRPAGSFSGYTRSTLEVTADFLQLCANDKSLSKDITKYNDEGMPQSILSEGYKVTHTVTLDLETDQVFKPALTSNNVSTAGEVYGLHLMSTAEQATDLFGTPSLIFNFSKSNKVLAYGKSHWLYFNDDKLVKASTANETTKHFTYELINQIPFEERFDDLIWSVNDVVKKGDKLEDGSQKEVEHTAEVSIKLHWSNYINKDQVLVSFELSNNASNGLNYSINDDNSNATYDWISEALNKPLDPKELIQKSKGEIVIDKRTKRYIYDNRLFFDVKGKNVRRITIGDSLYKTANDSASDLWRFGDYYQGQTLDDAMTKTSQPFEEVTDELHINYEDRKLILYAYDGEIYKIEINLFQST